MWAERASRQSAGATIQRRVLLQRDDGTGQNDDQTTAGGAQTAASDSAAQGDQGAGDLASVAGTLPLDLPTPDPVTLAVDEGAPLSVPEQEAGGLKVAISG